MLSLAAKIIIGNMAIEYFISYRRKSGGEVQARLIYDILCKQLGNEEKVFYDIENIGEGEFPEQIKNALGEAKHFILLVNEAFIKEWPVPPIEEDWYYTEIATAIENIGTKNITPVLFDRKFKFSELPEELKRFHCLDKCQTVKYLPEYAEYFGKKVGKHLGINATKEAVYDEYANEYGECFKKIIGDVFNIQIEVHNSGVEKINAEHVTLVQNIYQAQTSMPASNFGIDFDKIHFEFKTPKSAHKGEKKFFGRVTFVEKLFDKFQEQHCINIRARGGMGKTSVAYIFRDWVDKNHPGYYYKKHFVTVNVNSDTSIRSGVNKNLKGLIDEVYPTRLKTDEKCDESTLTNRIGHILAEVPQRCLLVIDVNSDDNRKASNERVIRTLSAIEFPEDMEKKWDILYLCREKIEKTYEDDETLLKDFEDDWDGAKNLFEHIYKRNKLNDDELRNLFELVFYHPLLIEQLAEYGNKRNKSYKELRQMLEDGSQKNQSVEKFNEYTIIYHKEEQDIVPYLATLFVFSDFKDIEKYILQHFALWDYDYIPRAAIVRLLKCKKYRESDIEGSLYNLVDTLVLTSDDEKGFRIHGLLADRLREQNFDYTDYISTICGILDGGKVDNGIRSCLRSTPIELFAEEKYLHLYRNGLLYFLKKLSGIRGGIRGDGWAMDFAYKAELLCRYYDEYGDSELSQKLLGEYKDKSSYHVYYDWLETQKDYDATLPDDGIVKIKGSNCKFKMIKVDGGEFKMGGRHVRLSDYYIGETQVTQELYREITKRNPSYFDERRLKKNTDHHPVETVSWFDCLEFLILLNERTGFKFRLPAYRGTVGICGARQTAS